MDTATTKKDWGAASRAAREVFRRWVCGPAFKAACRSAAHAYGWAAEVEDLRPVLARAQCDLMRIALEEKGIEIEEGICDPYSGDPISWQVSVGDVFVSKVEATNDLFVLPDKFADARKHAARPAVIHRLMYRERDALVCNLRLRSYKSIGEWRLRGWIPWDLPMLAKEVRVEGTADDIHTAKVAGSLAFIAVLAAKKHGVCLVEPDAIGKCREVLGNLADKGLFAEIFGCAREIFRMGAG